MFKLILIATLCSLSQFVNGKSIFTRTEDLFEEKALNDDPMIGVLSQEISFYLDGKYPGQYKSYIAASYVKFVEGGGARVVPVW